MHTKKEAKDLELFRNWSVHEFYRLKALITLIWNKWFLQWSKKKNNLNEQNFDGETNWSGDVNFHSITNESCDEHAVYFRRRLKWRTSFIRFPWFSCIHYPANRVSFALPKRRLCSQGMYLHTRYKKINILKNTQPSIKVEVKNIWQGNPFWCSINSLLDCKQSLISLISLFLSHSRSRQFW